MVRNINLEEVTDGKRYGLNDMVKADCMGCEGCSVCCHGMGSSIILDPYDIYQLTLGTNKSFEMLINQEIELNVVDGIILPNLKMVEESQQCAYLDKQGRCSIHKYRPGICRIFPLGRLYENGSFQYIIQVQECPKENKAKVKVRKWIDVTDVKNNEEFINTWHNFVKVAQHKVAACGDETTVRRINMTILQLFYQLPYEKEDFYPQFQTRLKQAELNVKID